MKINTWFNSKSVPCRLIVQRWMGLVQDAYEHRNWMVVMQMEILRVMICDASYADDFGEIKVFNVDNVGKDRTLDVPCVLPRGEPYRNLHHSHSHSSNRTSNYPGAPAYHHIVLHRREPHGVG